MKRSKPLTTTVGTLRGRDCIFLDTVEFQDGANTLVLRGEINGRLCTESREGYLPYNLGFRDVLALRMTELDSTTCVSASSFDEIPNSAWVSGLGGKVNQSHRHIIVQTYDYVFEVVCKSFELVISEVSDRPEL